MADPEVADSNFQAKAEYIRDSVIAERIEEIGDPIKPIVKIQSIRVLEVGGEISVAEGTVEMEFNDCKLVPDFEYVDELVNEMLKLYPPELPQGPDNYRTQLLVFKEVVISRLKLTDKVGTTEYPDNYDNSEVLNELEFKIKELLGKCGFKDVKVVPALYAKPYFNDKKDSPIRTEVLVDTFGRNVNLVSKNQGFKRGVPSNLQSTEISNLENGITVLSGLEFRIRSNPSKRALATALTMQFVTEQMSEEVVTVAIKKLTEYSSLGNLFTLFNKFKPHEFENSREKLSRLAKDILVVSLGGSGIWPPEPKDMES